MSGQIQEDLVQHRPDCYEMVPQVGGPMSLVQEIHHNKAGEITSKSSGSPLMTRISAGAGAISCDSETINQLQWYFVTPTHKSFVMDAYLTFGNQFLKIQTINANYTLRCPSIFKRENEENEEKKPVSAISFSVVPGSCGNGRLDSGEECEPSGQGCTLDCKCLHGWIPINPKTSFTKPAPLACTLAFSTI